MKPFQKSAKTSSYQRKLDEAQIEQKGVGLSAIGIEEYYNEWAKGW